MPLLPDINELIAEVEKLSGRKVVVQEDPFLPVLATVQTARGSAPFHLVRYRVSGETLNYLIVYQLAFLVRIFSCPEGERWEVSSTEEEKELGMQSLGLAKFSPVLASSMIGSLLTQLRTYPIGMRIDEWILEQFPNLRAEQEISVRNQLSENERALSPEIRSRFPKELVDANSGMNAAYAIFWSKLFNERRYQVPFAALGYGSVAGKLLGEIEKIPRDATADRQLVENWAKILGLSDYFHFQSHRFDD